MLEKSMLEEVFPRMPEVSWLDNVCLLILILSAFNWVAFAFYDFNVVMLAKEPLLQKIIYGVIGFSGIKALFFWKKCLVCSRS